MCSHTGPNHSFVADRLLLRSDYIQYFVTATVKIWMEEVLYIKNREDGIAVFKVPCSEMTKLREEIKSILKVMDHCAPALSKGGTMFICARLEVVPFISLISIHGNKS